MAVAVRSGRVSIIIPTFNRAEWLPATIASALAQDYSDVEVVVVDDGSTDSTSALLDRYGDRIVRLRQPNRGTSAARNAGLACATGEMIVFLDSDDVMLPQQLRLQTELLRDHPEVDLVYGNG